jgi:NADP-dependent 3-hydroxy acid dehydrogenase YdfG
LLIRGHGDSPRITQTFRQLGEPARIAQIAAMRVIMSVQGLAGKTVVVTGAGRGLGAAFSSVLTELGAHVIMTGRNPEALGATAEAIRARYGTRPRTEHLDLSDPGEVTRWAKGLRNG